MVCVQTIIHTLYAGHFAVFYFFLFSKSTFSKIIRNAISVSNRENWTQTTTDVSSVLVFWVQPVYSKRELDKQKFTRNRKFFKNYSVTEKVPVLLRSEDKHLDCFSFDWLSFGKKLVACNCSWIQHLADKPNWKQLSTFYIFETCH